MGQAANSGRNASLDSKKLRAAGRQQHDPRQEAIADAGGFDYPRGRTAGAFGKPSIADALGAAGPDDALPAPRTH
jgi:hypothetical protein